ncbi:hypothetical protein NHN26_07900 [Rhodovulum tesquicola]|uniref:hypothetical protein n=1 Tax=Rhodovulum tesquicola TaxID=540254 RepID=UPI002098422E|nr:hypothetical protein [Rhodovulum tesquicola]MCO8145148.1 hypothetical protein [Rhodovulum tesquicola]
MTRILLLTTATLGLVALTPAAQACTLSALTLTCADGTTSTDQRWDEDGLTIRVESGATVSSTGKTTPAFRFDGDDITLTNDGLIENPNTANDNANNAIEVRGTNQTYINNGTISGGDRGIHSRGGDGGLTVINAEGALIEARRQAVRGGEDYPGTTVINDGVIRSTDGRALQIRGQGSSVTNNGELYGGEEVVEARDDFTLINRGLIQIDETEADEDGVQFASGRAENYGRIVGTDDAIDMDEGEVYNALGGVLLSVGPDDDPNKAAIDLDGEFDNSRDPVRPAGSVRIVNEGYMEGPRAISAAYDPTLPDDHVSQARQSVEIVNSGTMVGRGGIAIGLAPTQGDSQLTLFGDSRLDGDVLFGAGDDLLGIGALTSDLLIAGLFDGGAGENTVSLMSYMLTDVLGFEAVDDDTYMLRLMTGQGELSGGFRNWQDWLFADGSRLSTAEFAAALAPAPVPLPAGLPLLLAGLAGFGALRLRARG